MRWPSVPAQPLPMVGLVRERFLPTYRVDPDAVRALAPGPFQPVVRDGAAFAGVCLVEMHQMRPEGWPAPLGFSHLEAVYRLIVEYRSPTRGLLRGIVAPRADASHPLVALGGRLLSHYPFHLSRLSKERNGDQVRLRHHTPDRRGDLDAVFQVDAAHQEMPTASRFASLDDAVDFLVGMEHSFSWDARRGVVHRSVITHAPWTMSVARPVRPPRLAFFAGEPFASHGGAVLDCVLHMGDVPHRWGATAAEAPGDHAAADRWACDVCGASAGPSRARPRVDREPTTQAAHRRAGARPLPPAAESYAAGSTIQNDVSRDGAALARPRVDHDPTNPGRAP